MVDKYLWNCDFVATLHNSYILMSQSALDNKGEEVFCWAAEGGNKGRKYININIIVIYYKES